MAKAKLKNKEEKIARTLELISGGESVKRACELVGIARPTFLENVGSDNYARARECCADVHFDGLLELADKVEHGEIDPQAARVAADIKKWNLARMKPKSYGDSSKVDHTSSDGSMSPSRVVDLGERTTDELMEMCKALRKGGE